MANPKYIAEYFEKNADGTALAKTLEHVFNTFGSDHTAKEAADYICTHCHRTIQQSIMRGVVILLRRMAAVEYYDDRNEASVKMARAAVKAIDEQGVSSLPMI